MTAGQLVIRMATRAGIDVERAAREIPGVVAALRQEIGDEFFDITVQLPGEYRALLDGPATKAGLGDLPGCLQPSRQMYHREVPVVEIALRRP
jgi:hypothetical protein